MAGEQFTEALQVLPALCRRHVLAGNILNAVQLSIAERYWHRPSG
jgi:hypothetical protein